MIIDFHTHFYPDRIARQVMGKLLKETNGAAYSDGTLDGLLQSMDRAGIDMAINLPVATNPLKVEKMNIASAESNRRQGRIFSLGCIHPDCADIKAELKRISRLGLKGFKLHPYFQQADFDDIRYLRLLNAAGELDLVAVTHAGTDFGFPGQIKCTTKMILSALHQVGPVKLLLAHMGGYGNWEEAEELAEWDSVYLDTAFTLGEKKNRTGGFPNSPELLTAGRFMEIVSLFGKERILFGSDSPWFDQSEALALINGLPLTAAAKERIFCLNTLALLGGLSGLREGGE